MGCRHSHHSKSSRSTWHELMLLPSFPAGSHQESRDLGHRWVPKLTGAKSPLPCSAEATFEAQEVDTRTPTLQWGLRCLPGCLQHVLERVSWDATMKNNKETGHHEQQPVNNRYENKVGNILRLSDTDYNTTILTMYKDMNDKNENIFENRSYVKCSRRMKQDYICLKIHKK